MNKLVVVFCFSLLFCFGFLSIGNAAPSYDFGNNSGVSELSQSTGLDNGGAKDPEYYIGNFLRLLFSFLGIIFFILTIYSGINWMTAQGDSSQVTKAKETLIRAIVGLVICLAAYGITYFAMNVFNPIPTGGIIDDHTQIIDGTAYSD